MPPDLSVGRERHVRDVTAKFSQNVYPSPLSFNFNNSSAPLTPESTPPASQSLASKSGCTSLETNTEVPWSSKPPFYRTKPNLPPLTPRSSSDSLSLNQRIDRHRSPALIESIFDSSNGNIEKVDIISSELPCGLQGLVVTHIVGPRSVYILGLTSALSSKKHIRDLVVDVLDMASEDLEADEVIFVLEKQHERLRELLQGLIYVGGTVIKKHDNLVKESVVLVGIEI